MGIIVFWEETQLERLRSGCFVDNKELNRRTHLGCAALFILPLAFPLETSLFSLCELLCGKVMKHSLK